MLYTFVEGYIQIVRHKWYNLVVKFIRENMAFVYKAQRRSVTPQRLVTPGPADYVNIEGSVAAQNRAPFLTKVSRMPQTSQPMDNAEYRLYNLAKLALVSERSFKSPLGPVKNSMPVVEHKRPSPHFGSKVERFNKSSNEDCPGPGYYGWDKSLDRRVHVPVLAAEKVPQEKPPRLLPRNKSVPSIPSRTQSHGYTEAHGKVLKTHIYLTCVYQMAILCRIINPLKILLKYSHNSTKPNTVLLAIQCKEC